MSLIDKQVVVLITGVPAAGKSTVAGGLARRFETAVHVRGDVFRRMVVAGREEMGSGASADVVRSAGQTAVGGDGVGGRGRSSVGGMWRILGILVGGVGILGWAPVGEQGPSVGEVAGAIGVEGWYADPGAVGDREQLAVVAERLGRRGEPMGFALLTAEPAGSSTTFAEDVLDELGAQGDDIRTVVVLSDVDLGVVSDVWSDEAIDAALDETIDDLRANPTDGLEALADALAAEPTGFDEDSDSTDDGGPDTGLIVAGVLVLGGLVLVSRYFSDTTYADANNGNSDSDDGSSWSRRRRSSFYRSSSRSRSSSSSGGSSRRSSSSSSSHRGRGGRRL